MACRLRYRGRVTVVAVDRAFQLLRAVPETDGTLSALARTTGLPLATVARLMGTLEQTGAVRRDNKAYRIGPAVLALAGAEQAPFDLLALASAHLHELAAETDETAGLVEAVGTDCVHLGQVATEHAVAVRDWTGLSVPAHHGAIGFVIMAHWTEAEVEAYTAGPLEAFSPRTIVDPVAIDDRLAAVRRTGWLWTTDEYADGVTTVAAAIRGADGRAVGSLHVHGPTFRFPPRGRRRAIGRSVAARARAISEVLGWRT